MPKKKIVAIKNLSSENLGAFVLGLSKAKDLAVIERCICNQVTKKLANRHGPKDLPGIVRDVLLKIHSEPSFTGDKVLIGQAFSNIHTFVKGAQESTYDGVPYADLFRATRFVSKFLLAKDINVKRKLLRAGPEAEENQKDLAAFLNTYSSTTLDWRMYGETNKNLNTILSLLLDPHMNLHVDQLAKHLTSNYTQNFQNFQQELSKSFKTDSQSAQPSDKRPDNFEQLWAAFQNLQDEFNRLAAEQKTLTQKVDSLFVDANNKAAELEALSIEVGRIADAVSRLDPFTKTVNDSDPHKARLESLEKDLEDLIRIKSSKAMETYQRAPSATSSSLEVVALVAQGTGPVGVLVSYGVLASKFLLDRHGDRVQREVQTNLKNVLLALHIDAKALTKHIMSQLFSDGKNRALLDMMLSDKASNKVATTIVAMVSEKTFFRADKSSDKLPEIDESVVPRLIEAIQKKQNPCCNIL